ncbi:Hypothetical protein, putative HAD family hydrolase [Mycoplasmopsis bovigenitalium 51080]|uniref:COF family HAD hydrolase protein n=1 Tax=Mycoplasmopsis bovigenitalium 51080 TaxID=1188235 RepID=N9V1B4_9BACT|nr:HAD-IIB family hydrolase [Mycoplasmopsis bovigenitalium]ENY69172.1 Hypothetical protein, putative HAD family hydrolase [Mycoplasmopsis bovigenitalium 51080]
MNKLTYFIDLDGTLFDTNGVNKVSPKNQYAILIMKNFANVVLSTGRSYQDLRVKQVMNQLAINDVICSSGAELYIDNKLVFSTKIELETVLKIIEFANKNKISFMVYDENGDHLFLNNNFVWWLANKFLRKWIKTIDISQNFDINNFTNINKFSFGFLSVFKTKKILKKLQAFLGDKINAYISTRGHVIEITDKKANKALATEQYLSIKQIELQNTIHIGDSMTDACLKGYVGKLVAMGNSPAGFKRIADEVAPKNKRAGIHKYLIKKQIKKRN